MIDLKDFKGAAARLDTVDIPRMAARINVPEDRVHAIDETESLGSGFDKLGRPKMLFEPHMFYRLLSGADRDKAVAAGLAYPKWKKDYPADSYPRMMKAMAINRDAALKAASWGRYQCLGDHFAMLGYSSVDRMVQAFMDDEEDHLEGFVTFIINSGVDDDLRAGRYDVFFRVYNGPAYVQNGYPQAFKINLAKWAKGKGYAHLRVDGEFLPTDAWPKLDRYKEHTIELPVADLLVDVSNEARLRAALAEALEHGKGVLHLLTPLKSALIAGRAFELLGNVPLPGSIAFVPTATSWLPPMRRTVEGVLGSQDVNICR